MSRNSHYRTRSVSHENIIRDKYRHLHFVYRVYGATSNNHTRLLIRQLLNDSALNIPKLILICKPHRSICENCGQPTAGGIFAFFFDIVCCISAFFRNLQNQFCVITRNTKFFRYSFSNSTSPKNLPFVSIVVMPHLLNVKFLSSEQNILHATYTLAM